MKVAMIGFSGTITELHYLRELIGALLGKSEVSQISLALPEYSSAAGLPTGIWINKFPFPISLPKAMIKALDPLL